MSALNEENEPVNTPPDMCNVQDGNLPRLEFKVCLVESRRNVEDSIHGEISAAGKELLFQKLTTVVNDAVDDIPCGFQ